MKKKLLTLLVVFSHFFLFAEGDIKQFTLNNGIPVYVKYLPENHINVINLVEKGGVDYYSEELSGIEDAVLALMVMGSKKYSYSELQTFEYETQSSISGNAMTNGAIFQMISLDKYFDRTFERFSDAFLSPSFQKDQYKLLIREYDQNIQQTLNNPGSMLFYYAKKVIYAGHPYAVSPDVTPESAKNITLDNIKKHHRSMLDSRRISFVCCGNFDEAELLQKLNSTFGKLPARNEDLVSKSITPLTVEGENAVFVHQAAGGTGFVARIFATPDVYSDDYPVALLASEIYSTTLFNVVREKHGVCYSAQSSVLSSKAPFGLEYLYRVSNLSDFSKALEEARLYMSEGKLLSGKDSKGNYNFELLEDRLMGFKNKYINNRFLSQKTTSGVAGRLSASLLYYGDVEASGKLVEIVNKATAEDVIRVFNRYWLEEPSRWFAVVAPQDEDKVKF